MTPLNFNRCIRSCNFTPVGTQSISVVPQSCIMPFCGQSPPLPRPDTWGLLSPQAARVCWPSSCSGPDGAFRARSSAPRAPEQGLQGLRARRLCHSLLVRERLTASPAPLIQKVQRAGGQFACRQLASALLLQHAEISVSA